MSLSPEALILILLGEAVGSMEGPTTDDQKNETDATETGDAAAQNSASVRVEGLLVSVRIHQRKDSRGDRDGGGRD